MNDPVLARRARIRRLCELGQRIGYSCFALAVVLFVVAFVTQFPGWLVTVIVASMALGSIVLAPAIVAELSLLLWLLIRGIDTSRWEATVR